MNNYINTKPIINKKILWIILIIVLLIIIALFLLFSKTPKTQPVATPEPNPERTIDVPIPIDTLPTPAVDVRGGGGRSAPESP